VTSSSVTVADQPTPYGRAFDETFGSHRAGAQAKPLAAQHRRRGADRTKTKSRQDPTHP